MLAFCLCVGCQTRRVWMREEQSPTFWECPRAARPELPQTHPRPILLVFLTTSPSTTRLSSPVERTYPIASRLTTQRSHFFQSVVARCTTYTVSRWLQRTGRTPKLPIHSVHSVHSVHPVQRFLAPGSRFPLDTFDTHLLFTASYSPLRRRCMFLLFTDGRPSEFLAFLEVWPEEG
jgi:hypothetical protein